MSTVDEIRTAIERLSREERARLLDQVWRVQNENSAAEDQESLPDDPSIVKELGAREEAFQNDPASVISWEAVKKNLRRGHA